MKTTRFVSEMGRNGNLYIPADLRNGMGLGVGDKCTFSVDGSSLIAVFTGKPAFDRQKWASSILAKYGKFIIKTNCCNGETEVYLTNYRKGKARISPTDQYDYNVGVAVAICHAVNETVPFMV